MDIAVQTGGSVSTLPELIKRNGLPDWQSKPAAGQTLTLDEPEQPGPGVDEFPRQLRQFYRQRGLRVNTGHDDPRYCPAFNCDFNCDFTIS
jgi:hypothetical protein